jgi:hypothetical protein
VAVVVMITFHAYRTVPTGTAPSSAKPPGLA